MEARPRVLSSQIERLKNGRAKFLSYKYRLKLSVCLVIDIVGLQTDWIVPLQR